MCDVTIQQLEDYLGHKYQGQINTSGLFMKLVEEIGEIAEAINQLEGRKKETAANSLEYELADALHYIFAIAAINKIDLTKAIVQKDQAASLKYGQTPNLVEFITGN